MFIRILILFVSLITVLPLKGQLYPYPYAPFDIEELDKLRLLIVVDKNIVSGQNAVLDQYVALKRLFGFDVECVYVKSSTTPDVIRDSIDSWKSYVGNRCTKFVLLVGDIKSYTHKSIYDGRDYSTDLYYYTDLYEGCKFDDIQNVCYGGRLYSSTHDGGSVSALVQLAKIMEYETNPPEDNVFYKSAVHCSMFDDREEDYGYEDMRMVQTSEDIMTMAHANGINVSRYYTTNRYSLRYRYNKTFGGGALIDSSIHFATVYSAYDDSIRHAIDRGALYVMYNGHGGETYWCSPSFDSWTRLQNGTKYPIM
ncbi:MAG: C25 family cysteine peptidase, partial [Muribaculum sp.]|nr:C25 family cysteine peptidase [Muribaculum sp.]